MSDDWRPARRRRREWDGAWRVDHEPATPGAELDVLARRFGLPSARALGGVFRRWPEIVGVQAAAHSRPVRLRGTTLLVAVDHPAWATSLRHLQATLLGRLDEVCGAGAVTTVEVRVEHPT